MGGLHQGRARISSGLLRSPWDSVLLAWDRAWKDEAASSETVYLKGKQAAEHQNVLMAPVVFMVFAGGHCIHFLIIISC